jgi:hypothetical protein
LQPAKHGAVFGTLVHGGHGSGVFDLHVDHGGDHGVHTGTEEAAALICFDGDD